MYKNLTRLFEKRKEGKSRRINETLTSTKSKKFLKNKRQNRRRRFAQRLTSDY